MSKKKNRNVLPLLIVAVLVALGLYGYGPGEWFGSMETAPLRGAVVRRGPLRISVTERGNLKAKNAVSLRNEVEGRVTILSLIDEGTTVEAGDVLARLDTSSLEDRLVAQKISVQNARANLTKSREAKKIQELENESLIARAQLDVTFAEIDKRKYLEGDWPQQLQEAEDNILLAEEDLKRAEDRYKWSLDLAEKGFLTRTELEADELALQRATIKVSQSKRAKELLIEYAHPKEEARLDGDLLDTQRELEKVRLQAASQLVDYETAHATNEEKLALEEEKLAKYESQIEKATIRAPVAGMVVYGRESGGHRGRGGEPISEGGEVRERQEIISIPAAGGMIVEAKVHESVLKQVEVGQEALLRIDTFPGREFHGRVEFVAVMADQGSWWSNPDLREYRTEISIQDSIAEMRPGMSTSIEILVEELNDVLQVPLQAVHHRRGENICFVLDGEEISERKVEVGRRSTLYVHLVSGLKEGEMVLLAAPPDFLREAAEEVEDADAPGSTMERGEGSAEAAGGSPVPSEGGAASGRPGGAAGSSSGGGRPAGDAAGGGRKRPSGAGGGRKRPQGGGGGGEGEGGSKP